ncbi:MAG: VWA domain-containing protein [Chloroflexi bacterium]|nr:VWA domain-containing protein [Chloroflexota bacterium]
MKKLLPLLLFVVVLLPVTLFAMQDSSAVRIEITGVNATDLPTAVITANVYDALGQPRGGLTAAEFTLTGALADFGQIVEVQNITDDALPFATVLVLDVSSSMSGIVDEASPFGRAKEAARAFVADIREGDPVALVTFGTNVSVVQPFTTDHDAVLAAIDNLNVGGETALYQAGYDAVRLAAEAPVSRRVVVLLSDGGEYGGNSLVERDAAALEALTRGVPVYTVGLGFGTDRSYLAQLSESTNARFYESPTPEQLETIYTELAALLRSQYVITLNADVPLDGTVYPFGLRVTVPEGTDEATAELRAPIPIPVIVLPNLPTEPITQLTTITAQVGADDALTGVSFAFDDAGPVSLTEAPYEFTIDPAQFAPGTYPLTVAATDEDGDVGLASAEITIGALPPTALYEPDLASLGEIAEPVTVTITAGGQTPVTEVSVAIDGGTPVVLTEPYSFTIDPLQFTPGQHAASVTLRNAGGREGQSTLLFTIAAVPPVVAIRGLEDGQSITEPVTFTIGVTGQGAVTNITATADETPLVQDSSGLIGLDPMTFPPGATDVTVSVTTDNGQTGQAAVTVLIGALPPQILLTGLSAGDNLTADTNVQVNFVSQTPITDAMVLVDGDSAETLTTDPAEFTIAVLDYAPGEHTLTIAAQNASDQTGTIEIPFTIDPAPAASATAAARAQATATQQTINATASAVAVQATATQEAIVAATVVAQSQATATQEAVIAATAVAQSQATATQEAVIAASGTAQFEADQTATANAAQQGTGTAQAGAATAQAVAESTQAAVALATQAAAAEIATGAAATLTGEAAAAANAEATVQAATASAEALDQATAQAAAAQAATAQAATAQAATTTGEARQTESAFSATAAAASAEALAARTETAATAVAATAAGATAGAATATAEAATANAGASATANADATTNAEASATANADASATANADASATANAEASATADANASATADATATSAQQLADLQTTVQMATRDALATSNAQARQNAQQTQDARSTRSAVATQAAVNTATAESMATSGAEATLTAEAQASLEAQQTADASATVAQRTQSAQQTASANDAATANAATAAAATESASTAQAATEQAATADAATADTAAALTEQAATEQAATRQAATEGAATVAQSALIADQTATAIAEAIASETAQSGTNQAASATALAEENALAATATAIIEQATGTAQAFASTTAQSGQEATSTAAAVESALFATATAIIEEATANAQETRSAQQTAVAAPTEEATATPLESVAQAASPTPEGTLTPITADSPPAGGDLAPLLLVGLAVLVILLLLFFALRGNRQRP